MEIVRAVFPCALLLAFLGVARPARARPAEEPTNGVVPRGESIAMTRNQLVWDERWHRFRPIEYVTTAATGAGAVYFLAIAKGSDHPKWEGPILFDAAVRDVVRVRSAEALTTWAHVGDALSFTVLTQAVMIDAVVLPLVAGNADLAFQLTLMNAQVFAASGLVIPGLYTTTGRARPSYSECFAQTSRDPLCGRGSFSSFPSGHAGTAFAAAGVTCVNHRHLPLYGGGAWDVAACVESLTLATGSAMIRLVADRHYASDVIVGSSIGLLFGYGLPTLLHYGFAGRRVGTVVDLPHLKVGLAPGVTASGWGATAIGVF